MNDWTNFIKLQSSVKIPFKVTRNRTVHSGEGSLRCQTRGRIRRLRNKEGRYLLYCTGEPYPIRDTALLGRDAKWIIH